LPKLSENASISSGSEFCASLTLFEPTFEFFGPKLDFFRIFFQILEQLSILSSLSIWPRIAQIGSKSSENHSISSRSELCASLTLFEPTCEFFGPKLDFFFNFFCQILSNFQIRI